MEKLKRQTALGKFTRNENTLKLMLDNNSPTHIITPQYEKLNAAWDKLEEAHDNFLETATPDAVVEGDETYLDGPSLRWNDMVARYSEHFNRSADADRERTKELEREDEKMKDELRREAEEKVRLEEAGVRFEGEKAELSVCVATFKRLAISATQAMTNASDSDKRLKLQKMEEEYSTLKSRYSKLAGIDQSRDLTEFGEMFVADVETPFIAFQKDIIAQLKDSTTSGGGLIPSSSTNASGSSNSKKEMIKLPSFEGDESSSPYVSFPVWKKQWDIQIEDYEERHRAGLLKSHVDSAAAEKFIGHEGDYTAMMKRLVAFFGDRQKVIRHVLNEVMSARSIMENDYGGLISYSTILENNYCRLSSMSLQNEMSNTSIMTAIIRRFPCTVAEKWHQHLLSRPSVEQVEHFPMFISWISSERAIWERMASTQDLTSARSASYYAGNGSLESNSGERTCYKCGKTGHMRWNCPSNSKPKDRDQKTKPAKVPHVKKFWCALHKGDKSKKCYSNSCMELRKMTDIAKRIELLKENGDCIHCCGDHKPNECKYEERVCGGGRNDRGCAKPHKVHELFCKEAKVFACMVMNAEIDEQSGGEPADGVVLCIMVVAAPKGYTATVFWDSGATSNFVRENFAELCGFKGKSRTLSVTTLGNVTTDYLTVIEYNCRLIDCNGDEVLFKAYGLERITGAVTKMPASKLEKLFPGVSPEKLKGMERGKRVDFLIGISNFSWQPVRKERASGGGDLWMCENQFGVCYGGRHPDVNEGTRRSDDLFHVNVDHSAYFAEAHPVPSASHMLEFCPSRAALYELSQQQTSRTQVVALPKDREEPSSSSVPFQQAVEKPCAATEPFASVLASEEPVVEPLPLFRPVESNLNASAASWTPVLNTNTQHNPTTQQQHNTTTLNTTLEEFSPAEPAEPTESVICSAAMTCPITAEKFFQYEALGTQVEPSCGGCQCGKCAVPGSVYSFKEQVEFDQINSNLTYDADKKRWITAYPWKSSRSALPRNEKAAFQCLLGLEKTLKKNPDLAMEYNSQIQAMVDRGAAVLLSEEERKSWEGDYYYLPIVGVKGKKSLRVCFDAARKQCGCESMNYHLSKGPDRFINDLLSVLLAFRNGRVGFAGDIIKFHNQVHLVPEDMMMQRFQWRNMETDREPDHYAVPVNNFGVVSANAIATCALRKSADEFSSVYPVESEEVKTQTYVDDQLGAAENMEAALLKTKRWDEIGDHASMPNKGWTYSGSPSPEVPLGGEDDVDKRLGQMWDPVADTFLFRATLRVKLRRGGTEEITISTVEELVRYRESMMTRRMLLSNVQSIFDPTGLLSPILLQAKLLLRKTWTGSAQIGWDDPLPDDQADEWMAFLSSLLNLTDVRFQRSLWPQEEVVGDPMLIVFSDGSTLAFGVAAYIRWELKSGGFWTQLIIGKSKIAPKHVITIPRMELNGAVLGNRIKNYLLKNLKIKFGKVWQFVDSSTVLGYFHKPCGVYNRFEGPRVAEVQSTNKFTDGRLVGFAWVAGKDNPADWVTKPRQVKDLVPADGFWQCGPEFLRLKESEWSIKLTYRTDRLDGEIIVSKQCHAAVVNCANADLLGRIVHRFGTWKKMLRILSWILRLCDHATLRPSGPLLASEIIRAKKVLLTYVQSDIAADLKTAADTGKGRYRRLAPSVDEEGLWRVGSRVRQYAPFTLDHKLPVLLPTEHPVTLRIMEQAHRHCHRASDDTLSRFRIEGYWAVKGGVLAKKVASACVPCRKRSHKTLTQPLGELPSEQLKDPVAWGSCQLDLFGPFLCRSDVNARARKKTWGMVVEDVNSGAVHLDVLSDYSTNAVLMSLRRFGSLRGWPGQITSDPGSQLESAGGKLESWWGSFGDQLKTYAGTKNFVWKTSPPDSPWRQGKVERRIGVVKRILHMSVGDTCVTPLELQTILMEAANICNERPLGLSKPRDDGSYSVITPNSLLLGRSINVLPDDAELSSELGIRERYRVIRHVTTSFWHRWCSEVTPQLVFRQKWHEKSRNLCVGDLVLICEPSRIKAKYKLAIVEAVSTSKDGCVRSASVRYSLNNRRTTVERSVQRLVLILPVEEQDGGTLTVKDFDTHSEVCRSPGKAGV